MAHSRPVGAWQPRGCIGASGVALLLTSLASGVRGGEAEMLSGFRIEGQMAQVGSVGVDPLSPVATDMVQLQQILMIDDGLRRTFVPATQVARRAEVVSPTVRITIDKQRVPAGGRRVVAVGNILRVGPFNEFGRRTVSISMPQGPIDIVQGITEITPHYVKLESLTSPYLWEMRVATSSVSRKVLRDVLLWQIDAKDPDQRRQIFELYTVSDRFTDARLELEDLIRDFPTLSALKTEVRRLNQLGADSLVREIEFRRQAGQHRFASQVLQRFPTDGVAAETLLKVRDLAAEYETMVRGHAEALRLLDEHLKGVADEETRTAVTPVCEQIKAELGPDSLPRMAGYLRLSDDESLKVEQKLALAVSGWLMGGDNAIDNMAVVSGLARAQPLIQEYLATPQAHLRQEALRKLGEIEGVSPANVAKIIALAPPPLDLSEAQQLGPRLFELTAPGPTGQPDVKYLVLLPPEYSTQRRYPVVMTLHGGGTTAELQIDWWAGSPNESGDRGGPASRQGYIVIAPRWTREHQRRYEFSYREHAIVLTALRDACSRLAIDTDKMFLSGHSMGGDAVWDLGLAHPDLWAGVIPIVANADKYVSRYWENSKGLAMYFVEGDMDSGRTEVNTRELDRMLTASRKVFDVTLVEYRGRGHDHFQDEIQRIFTWMTLHKRDFAPRSIDVSTLRSWDNFFWWVELDQLPDKQLVAPEAWPRPGVTPVPLTADVRANNTINVNSSAGKVRVWLSPDLVRFDQPLEVVINRRKTSPPAPSVAVLLEDARTRCDRQHPFWAVAEN